LRHAKDCRRTTKKFRRSSDSGMDFENSHISHLGRWAQLESEVCCHEERDLR
jgi:hypothetical protein